MSERPITLPISTAKELIDFAHAINKLHNEQQRDLAVTLTSDIDLTGVEWTPIGNEDIPFYGTFDGGGHTISGLHIDKTEGGCCGLFGVCAGTIENLTVTGSITCVAADAHSAVGGIAGLVVGGHISNWGCMQAAWWARSRRAPSGAAAPARGLNTCWAISFTWAV